MNKYMNTALIIIMSIYSPFSYSEEYYRYLGDYPKNANPGWHEDVQGVTHDDNYWFITQSDTGEADEQVLWKVPVGHDLKVNARSNPNTITREIRSYPQLNGYNHFGDLDYYKYRDVGFLIVGLSGNIPPIIAVFRADTLEYVTHSSCLHETEKVSWVAIDPNGQIYFPAILPSNPSIVNNIVQHTIDWDQLYDNSRLLIVGRTIIDLYNEQGEKMFMKFHQGGVFSPSGSLFYLVTGYYKNTDPNEHGIHVFDTITWRRVKKSTNGFGEFNYEFHPGCCKYEEAEGLTIWDLDDGRAPGIRGQLHVFMLDNDWSSADEIYFKHYSSARTQPRPPPINICRSDQICCNPGTKGRCIDRCIDLPHTCQ